MCSRYYYYHTILHMGELKPEKVNHLPSVTQLMSLRARSVGSISQTYLTVTFHYPFLPIASHGINIPWDIILEMLSRETKMKESQAGH